MNQDNDQYGKMCIDFNLLCEEIIAFLCVSRMYVNIFRVTAVTYICGINGYTV